VLFGPRPLRIADPLLESLIELLRQSGEYRGSMQLLLRLAREPWAQGTIFPEESRLARRFAAENATRLAEPADFVARNLQANVWRLLWLEPLSAAPLAQFEATCSVRGAEHLHAALAAGKGAILAHAHTVVTQLFWTWLRHARIDAGVTLWQWAWSNTRAYGDMQDAKVRALKSARELYAAAGLLRAGGLVHVLADGPEGSRRLELPFFGRSRSFATSFAELALHGGAPVLGVFVSLGDEGSVVIDIEPIPAAPDAAALVGNYVDWLGRQWRQHAGALPWPDVRIHLSRYQPLQRAAAP
jgi:hypothetical protein